jgi:hypothetical protein
MGWCLVKHGDNFTFICIVPGSSFQFSMNKNTMKVKIGDVTSTINNICDKTFQVYNFKEM